METITLERSFTNLQNALNLFINEFIATYRQFLIRDNKKASGNLINSLKPLTIQFSNNKMECKISIASYWKYVEWGRKPGKFPPIDNILSWIKIKPVLPRPMNGLKPPTESQLAFLIARKIARDGIQPGNQYTEALDIVWNKNKANISNAISKDLEKIVELIKI